MDHCFWKCPPNHPKHTDQKLAASFQCWFLWNCILWVTPWFATPSFISLSLTFILDLENIKSRGSWLEKTQFWILLHMTIDINSKNCSLFVKEHEVEPCNTSSLTCQSWRAFQECAVLSTQPWELSHILQVSFPAPHPRRLLFVGHPLLFSSEAEWHGCSGTLSHASAAAAAFPGLLPLSPLPASVLAVDRDHRSTDRSKRWCTLLPPASSPKYWPFMTLCPLSHKHKKPF